MWSIKTWGFLWLRLRHAANINQASIYLIFRLSGNTANELPFLFLNFLVLEPAMFRISSRSPFKGNHYYKRIKVPIKARTGFQEFRFFQGLCVEFCGILYCEDKAYENAGKIKTKSQNFYELPWNSILFLDCFLTLDSFSWNSW